MRVAICDDDKNIQTRYAAMVRRIAAEQGLNVEVNCYDSGDEFIFKLNDSPICDLCIMDISMPGRSGVEVARALREEHHYDGTLLFLTNSPDFMLDAFDVDAAHYIVKNHTPQEKQEKILRRVIEIAGGNDIQYAVFHNITGYRSIAISSIFYFEVVDHVMTVHYGEGQTFEFYASMSKTEAMMAPYRFIRTHRNLLVSAGHIVSYKGSSSGGDVVLTNGECVSVSRSFYPDVMALLRSHVPATPLRSQS